MSAWSSLAKAISRLFRGGGAAAGAAGATGAASSAAKVLTWGNTVKVAVVGSFTYLFLSGGASNVVSRTLGIPQEIAQVLIILVFVVLLILLLRYLVNYCRERFGLREEYLEQPIIRRSGESSLEPYDRRMYDGYGRYDLGYPDDRRRMR